MEGQDNPHGRPPPKDAPGMSRDGHNPATGTKEPEATAYSSSLAMPQNGELREPESLGANSALEERGQQAGLLGDSPGKGEGIGPPQM